MSLGRYFLHDFFTARELNAIEDRESRRNRRERQQRRSDRQRVEDLESELARVTMLARALAQACLARGVLTREELSAALVAADLADGVQDGGLDPEVALPGESRAADLEPLDPPAGPG